LDPGGANVATIRTSAGFKKFQAFCAEIPANNSEITALQANVIEDNKEEWTTPREEPLTTEFDLSTKQHQVFTKSSKTLHR
jgi:hypothetical protein